MLQDHSPLRSITELKPGDHVCCIYDTDEEHRNIVTPFLRKGLERNEKVVYIVDARDKKTIINYLKTDGVDVEHYQKKGQFSILTSTDTYLKGGVFEPDWMISILSSDTQKALDEGYTALRVTGEMSWALRGLPGSERLIEYENKLNTFLPGSRCLAICQYDRRQFDAGILLNVLLTHPFVFIGANLYHNFYYTSPNDILKPNQSDITLNGWIKNIMDRKATEAALRESEERYRTLVASVNDAIILQEETGEILTWNRAAERLFGVTAGEVLGHTATSRKWKTIREDGTEFSDSEHPSMHTLATGETCKNVIMGITSAEGRFSWVNVNTSPLFRQGYAKPYAVVISLLDITERKRAEEAVQYSETRFRELFNNMSSGVAVYEVVDDGADFVFVDFNRAAETIDKIKKEDVIGRRISEVFPGVDEFGLLEVLYRVWRTGKSELHPIMQYKDERIAGWRDNFIYRLPSGEIVAVYNDVTERRQAEVALKESETRLRQLVESTTDWVWTIDLEGCHTYSNPAIYDLLGYQVSEIAGTKAFPLLHPDDEPLIRDMVKQCIELKVGWHNVPIRWLHKDGSVRLFESAASPLVGADGQITGFSGIDRDITERKRVEDALHESEAKYRLIADNTADNIWIFDMDMHLQYISPSVEKMKGFTVKETLSLSLEEMITPESLESLMKRFHQEMELEASGTADPDRTVSFETEEYCKSGATILVENSVTLLRDAQGRPFGMLGISRDITGRKRVEEALRESEELFATAFYSGPLMLAISDIDTGIYLNINETFIRVTGYSRDEAIGKTSIELGCIGPEDRESLLQELKRTGRVAGKEFRLTKKDGDSGWYLFFGEIIKVSGKKRLLSLAEDITERKRAETALQQSEERYRIVTDAAHDVIYTLTPEGVVTFMNTGGSALIGMPPEKIVGLSLESLYHPGIAQELRGNLDTVMSTKRPVRFDSKFWHENPDQITWLDAQLVPQFGPDGSVVQVIGISRSITDRKQAEMLLKRFNQELESQVRSRTIELERFNIMLEAEVFQRTKAEESIRKSLNERELLLREIHHRVRNNLQIILSLISLQSRNIKDQKVLDTMGEFQNRIMAMAHVHERMCRADDISRIDLSEIVTFLGTSLFKSYKVNPQHIRLNVEIKDLHITLDSAIPISLIINELVSNSIKHAFPKGSTGEITITGRREGGTLVFSIRDNGIGIPRDIDWMGGKQSLGYRLVVSLVEQLQGTIELDRTTGTVFNIVVKERQ
jgi:PAS domain S-box-containing protein